MVFMNGWELMFGLVSIGTGVLSVLMAMVVFLGNPSLKENRAWAVACLATAVWGGGLGFAILAPDKASSLRWNQIFYSGGVWIPTAFLWFVSTFTKSKTHSRLLVGMGLVSFLLMLVLIFRLSWFVQDLVPKGPFRYWDVLGPAYHVFSALFFFGMFYSLRGLYKAMRSKSLINKTKLRWMFITVAMGFLGGATNFFYDYNIDIPPVGQLLVFLYPLLVSWAIIRHQALDIRLLLRRTSFLLAIYGFLIILTIPILLFFKNEIGLEGPRALASFFAAIITVGVVLSLGPFAYAYFVQRSRFFHEHVMAGLTHELKSPLAIIESSADLLAGYLQHAPEDVKQGEYLEMIERNSARLRESIDNLLLVMKLGKTKSMSMKPADLRELCAAVISQFRDAAANKNIELVFQGPSTPVNIFCDPTKIKQALSNLVSNAVKFTDKGSVTVSIKKVKEKTVVSIEDTGRGIPKEDLPFVFDRFYQGEAGRQSKGSGLGLSIVKLWVEAHGGAIHAESPGVDKGSRVWFTLPA